MHLTVILIFRKPRERVTSTTRRLLLWCASPMRPATLSPREWYEIGGSVSRPGLFVNVSNYEDNVFN